MNRKEEQFRSLAMEIQKREEAPDGDLFLEGYFAVYDSVYELWPGATESIARGAFAGSASPSRQRKAAPKSVSAAAARLSSRRLLLNARKFRVLKARAA